MICNYIKKKHKFSKSAFFLSEGEKNFPITLKMSAGTARVTYLAEVRRK